MDLRKSEILEKLFLELSELTGAETYAEKRLRANEKILRERITDLEARVQYLVDHWPEELEDGCITFPDGEGWSVTAVQSKKEVNDD